MLCQTENCNSAHFAKGLCARHYAAARRDPINERRFDFKRRYSSEWPMEWDSKDAFARDVGPIPGMRYRLRKADQSKPLGRDNIKWVAPALAIRAKDDMRAYQRYLYVLRKFGLSQEEYEGMLSRQGGVCLICKMLPTVCFKGAPPVLVVDHCHKTGRVRGLLCNQCNVGIAQSRENPETMLAAIKYLAEPGMP